MPSNHLAIPPDLPNCTTHVHIDNMCVTTFRITQHDDEAGTLKQCPTLCTKFRPGVCGDPTYHQHLSTLQLAMHLLLRNVQADLHHTRLRKYSSCPQEQNGIA
jgi:hypothetical protein